MYVNIIAATEPCKHAADPWIAAPSVATIVQPVVLKPLCKQNLSKC